MKLDNSIGIHDDEEGNTMATRQRFHITLINGEKVWITGKTINDCFDSALRQYSYLYRDVCDKWDTREACPSVEEYGRLWMERYKKPKIGYCRYKRIKVALENHLFQEIGGKRLDDVRLEDAQSVLLSINDMAYGTKKMYMCTYVDMFDYAIEDKYITENPFKSKKLEIDGNEAGRRSLTNEERDALFDSIQNIPLLDKLLYMIPLFSGLRRGEVFALKWEDIDFEKNLIHVHRNISEGPKQSTVLKTPKTEAGKRYVPLLPQLRSVLLEYKEKFGSDDTVIVTPGGKPYTYVNLKKKTNDIMHKPFIPKDISYHCLRHTFATVMSTKIDPKTLQYIMGHAKIDVTMQTYAHRDQQMVQDCAYLCTNIYE